MPQSMLNAARPAGRLFANLSSADCPNRPISPFDRILARFSLAFHSLFTRFSPAVASSASIFESNALTTSTFDSNT